MGGKFLGGVVVGLFLRSMLGFHSRKARENSLDFGRGGAVVQIQRFGSPLNLNVHFHALVLDGVLHAAPDAIAAPPAFILLARSRARRWRGCSSPSAHGSFACVIAGVSWGLGVAPNPIPRMTRDSGPQAGA